MSINEHPGVLAFLKTIRDYVDQAHCEAKHKASSEKPNLGFYRARLDGFIEKLKKEIS